MRTYGWCRGTESSRFAAAYPLQSLTFRGGGMKLTATEIAYVRAQGLHITAKCDACGTLLNRTLRHTIAGKPEVYCSAACRDSAFFRDRSEAEKHARQGRCAYCSGSLKGKKRGSIFCDDVCRKTHSRKIQRISTAEGEKSRTPTQSNQRVADAKIVERRNGITGGPRHFRNACVGVADKLGSPVEVEQPTSTPGRPRR